MTNDQERYRAINRQVVLTQVIGLPGVLLLGLGLYGLFGTNGDAFIPALNDKNVVYGCIAIGAVIELWQIFRMFSLHKQRMKLAGAEPL